jgi:hypothetical protein
MANHNVTFFDNSEIYKRIGAIKIIIEKNFKRRRMTKSNYSTVVMLPPNQKDMWYINSACINHMMSEDTIFANLDSLVNSKDRFGNNIVVEAKGKGNIIVLLTLNFKK